MSVLRALSVRQPWAWLIVHGHKPIENREWLLEYRGPLVIHASKRHQPEQRDDHAAICRLFPDIGKIMPPLSEMQFGGIVGIATVVDCITESDSPWFNGPFGIVLKDARPCEFVAFPGKLKLFPVNAHLVRPIGESS